MYDFLRKNIRKVLFSIMIMIVYLIVASPDMYNFVGSIVGLDAVSYTHLRAHETS